MKTNRISNAFIRKNSKLRLTDKDGKDDLTKSNIYREFLPIAVFSILVGLSPLSGVFCNRRYGFQFQWVSVAALVSGLRIVSFVCFLAYKTSLVVAPYLHMTYEFTTFVIVINFIVFNFQKGFGQVVTFFLAAKLPKHLQQWKSVERRLFTRVSDVEFASKHLCDWWTRHWTVACILLTHLIVGIACGWLFTPSPIINSSFRITYGLAIWLDVIPDMIFCFLCQRLCLCFRYLHLTIKSSFPSLIGFKVSSTQPAMQLSQVRRCFHQLIELSRDVDGLFAWPLLHFFAFNSFNVCVSFYYLIVVVLKPSTALSKGLLFRMIILSLSSIFRIIMICSAAKQVASEVEKIHVSLIGIPILSTTYKDDLQIQMLLNATKECPVSFRGYGLFEVNMSLLTKMAGVILSYLIILVQFQFSWPDEFSKALNNSANKS